MRTCRIYLNGNYSGQYSPYGALPWDSGCQGEDYTRNIALPNIDLASYHHYPSNTYDQPAITTAQVCGIKCSQAEVKAGFSKAPSYDRFACCFLRSLSNFLCAMFP